jgi:hypothetical protein
VGGGVAVGAAGGVLWALGSSRSSTASSADTTTKAKYQAATNDYNSAKTLFYVGIGGVAVGAAAATVGAVLMVAGHGRRRGPAMGAIEASPWVASGAGGVQVAGGF